MNKHILDITLLGVSSISEITTVKRTTQSPDKGILVNTTFFPIASWENRTLPADYNNSNLYIRNRKINTLPESEVSNTLITNDGLIAVYYQIGATKYLAVSDIFEVGTATYESVDPVDYQLLINHITADPIKKRTFICREDSGDLIADNTFIRQEGLDTYFYSEMDYPSLEVDEYGYYRVTTIEWESTYSTIRDFSFLKKQFIVLELSGLSAGQDVELILTDNNTDGIDITEISITDNLKVYQLKYLSIEDNDRYVEFNLVPTGTTYCGVRIY
jgi:hypothetical protein